MKRGFGIAVGIVILMAATTSTAQEGVSEKSRGVVCQIVAEGVNALMASTDKDAASAAKSLLSVGTGCVYVAGDDGNLGTVNAAPISDGSLDRRYQGGVTPGSHATAALCDAYALALTLLSDHADGQVKHGDLVGAAGTTVAFEELEDAGEAAGCFFF